MAKEQHTETELRAIEDDIVAALTEAADFRLNKERRLIPIVRGDKTIFSFTVEALNEDQWQKCRRDNIKNRNSRTEEFNILRYCAQVIYTATVPEDKERIWKNRAAWKNFNVSNGVDLVYFVLKPKEKEDITKILEKMSGYDTDADDLDELIKNE